MPSENSIETKRPTTKIHNKNTNTTTSTTTITGATPPQEQEHLPCPRCSSTNTKFCYYNNYNFSQPRHFCKSCRRYWTHGGTLRDIPVGGGTRKCAKRSRTSTTAIDGSAAAVIGSVISAPPLTSTPVLMNISGTAGTNLSVVDQGKSIDGIGAASAAVYGGGGGSFTSLLTTTQGHPGLFGFGLGIGHGLEDMGFGFGRGIWSFTRLGDHGGVGSGVVGGGGFSDAWQLESGDQSGFVGVSGGNGGGGGGNGDCFSWPDLAISTPGSME